MLGPMELLMRKLGLIVAACLALAACATQRQTAGTAVGVATGALVAGRSAAEPPGPW
jgi:hypothetical protein